MAVKHQRFEARQTMHNQTFEIFRYKDSYPKEVMLHHHDFYEVYFFLSGNVQYNIESVRLIVQTLKNLFFKGEGVSDVTGVVGTVYVIQEVTQTGGIDVYLELLALISVNLGVMNLLPIPGLDGSRLLFLLVEGVRRKPINREIEGAIHGAGFILLMGLMVLLTYKDIMQIFVR